MATTVDASGLLDALDRFAVEKLDRANEMFATLVGDAAPRRTQGLYNSIESTDAEMSGSSATATTKVTAEYADYVDKGTGIYGPEGVPITPKTPGGVLVFDWPAAGGIIFTRRVMGTPPTRFWSDAVQLWPQIVKRVEVGG